MIISMRSHVGDLAFVKSRSALGSLYYSFNPRCCARFKLLPSNAPQPPQPGQSMGRSPQPVLSHPGRPPFHPAAEDRSTIPLPSSASSSLQPPTRLTRITRVWSWARGEFRCPFSYASHATAYTKLFALAGWSRASSAGFRSRSKRPASSSQRRTACSRT